MDIFVPNRKLWIPDNAIADSLASPIAINRMIQKNRHIRCLTPHRVMMGAAGTIIGDQTSYVFDGTGDYLTSPDHVDWDFGSGDFTIDCWVRFTSTSSTLRLLSKYFQTGQRDWFLDWTTGNLLRFFFCTGTGDGTGKSVSWTPSTITWYHIVVARNGNNLRFFIGGIQQGATQDVTGLSTANTASELGIAALKATAGWQNFLTGRMDEIRISNIARWTSDFTPSNSQYESDSNTKLLIHCGETKSGTTGSGATFTDSGNTGHTVTENGNAIEDITIYKF